MRTKSASQLRREALSPARTALRAVVLVAVTAATVAFFALLDRSEIPPSQETVILPHGAAPVPPRTLVQSECPSALANANGGNDPYSYPGLERLKRGLDGQLDDLDAEWLAPWIDGLTPENLPSLLVAFLATDPARLGQAPWDALLSRWAEWDAPGAIRFALEHGGDAVKPQTPMTVWAEADFVEAARFVAAMPEAGEQMRLLPVLAQILWKEGNVAGFATAATLPTSWMRNAVLDRLVTLAFDSHRENIVEGVACGLEPVLAEPWAHEAVLNFAVRWSLDDPMAALEWTARLPDPALRSAAVADIAGNWAGLDPIAATTHLNRMPVSLENDETYAAIARSFAHADLEGARSWAEAIADPGLRKILLRQLDDLVPR